MRVLFSVFVCVYMFSVLRVFSVCMSYQYIHAYIIYVTVRHVNHCLQLPNLLCSMYYVGFCIIYITNL